LRIRQAIPKENLMTIPNGIVAPLASALEKRGYSQLTPVQEAVLSPDFAGRDALVSARTGSGKTVAFGLAIAPDLLRDSKHFGPAEAPLALAIAPTRELAMQVARELEWLYGEAGSVMATCVGGMDMRKERRALERGCHIVVGTPGRLRDHITKNALDLSNLRAVVLDEADEMLDLGFRDDLEFILQAAPVERRTLMFSATVPKSIAALAQNYQRNALRITASSEEKQHADIEYRALLCTGADRENAILNTLRYYDAATAIVFCSTRAAVTHLTARFSNRGFPAVSLSGELTQEERSRALQAMRDGRARVCIATDVAARGIDLPSLELVVHADLPTNAETLKHRSGRTGRAGRKGVSALIVPIPARRKAERLLAAADIRAEWANPPAADAILKRDDERLVADAQLSLPVAEDERDMVAALMAAHGAEKIVAAYVRQFRATRFAPEDIQEVSFTPSKARDGDRDGQRPPRDDFAREPARPREDFDESIWFSLSVGRKQNAEPRWLIPMLCRVGNLTKRDIGAIKMQQTETFVEIHASAVDDFSAALGKAMMIEGKVRVKKIEGMPDLSRAPKPREFAGEAKKTDWVKKPAGKDGKPPFKARPDNKGGAPDWKKKKAKRD
jgi:ATP-dependent RNA helicase DeaD